MSENVNTDDIVIVKKYANRRLYDTLTSSYVTLEDLCEMVKRGINFKVIDAKTEEDLTRSVLTQIIFEQESKGYGVLPVSFLRNIIGFYDDNLSAVLPTYLEGMMDHFSDNQEQMRSQMGAGKDSSPFAPFEEIQKQNMQMFEQTLNMFNPFAGNSDKKED
jgi:polyhydroxyalkanoate synthesis repressor PhaR